MLREAFFSHRRRHRYRYNVHNYNKRGECCSSYCHKSYGYGMRHYSKYKLRSVHQINNVCIYAGGIQSRGLAWLRRFIRRYSAWGTYTKRRKYNYRQEGVQVVQYLEREHSPTCESLYHLYVGSISILLCCEIMCEKYM